ncbi:MAG TPA: hypothetical protein VJ300_02095 [Thermoplasmata archaeon]|nr:hypothetical protein [Thermoplasmata archaeon]
MADPGSSAPAVRAHKARKSPRMTFRQEIQTIQNLPRTQRLIVILKVVGVFLVAIGLEGIVAQPPQLWLTAVFVPAGMFVSLLPIRIRTGRCIACMGVLESGRAICPACGAPQM